LQQTPQFKILDFFRGFAAFWVVMDHSCDRWIFSGNTQYLNHPLYAFSIRGQLGVVLFFVISGYCITATAWSSLYKSKSVLRYALDRIRRIYPPYLATLILTALATAVISLAEGHHLIPKVNHLQAYPSEFKFWFANLFLLQRVLDTPLVNIVFWSLCYEIFFYIIIGIFLKISQYLWKSYSQKAGTIFFVCSIGASAAITLVRLILVGTAKFPFDLWHEFAIGGLLFFLLEFKESTVPQFDKILSLTIYINVFVVTGLTIGFALLRRIDGTDVGHPSSTIKSFVSLLFCIILIAIRPIDAQLSKHRFLKPFMWLGAFSYSLYLTHPIILPFIDILSRRAGLTGSLYLIAFWLQVSIAVVFGRIFFYLVERHWISKRQVKRIVSEHTIQNV
jgi:peptidoglycan/LPS O-acetylase OafA/YrhL